MFNSDRAMLLITIAIAHLPFLLLFYLNRTGLVAELNKKEKNNKCSSLRGDTK